MPSIYENCDKKSLKQLEIPLNKFNDIAVPYHVDILYKHKTNIEKLERLGQWESAQREHVNAGRTVQQLRALLGEVDALRSQVRDQELGTFSKNTAKARQSIHNAIKAYLGMKKPDWNRRASSSHDEWPVLETTTSSTLHEADLPALQVQYDPEEEELARKEAYLQSWEHLHTEFQDLHQLFQEFSTIVHAQGDLVNQVETHTETVAENVEEGAKQLAYASRLKAASYPISGALLGGVLGGPIGLFAGLKLGALAAVSGGLLGFTGGRFLKNKETLMPNETDDKNIPKPTESTIAQRTETSPSNCFNALS